MNQTAGNSSLPAASNASVANPGSLPLVILTPAGGNYTFRTGDLDTINYTSIDTVLVFASQLGASVMLLLVMVLLTKPDKRLSPIFALNTVSLLLNFSRLLLMCLYYTGPLNGTYVILTGDVSSVPYSAYSTQIAAAVLEIVLVATLESSLALQVQVVCIDLRQWYRRTMFAVSACVALLAFCLRLAYGIANCQYILTYQDPEHLFVLEGASLNATAASIFFFSAVFTAKLGLALWKRRRMGLRRWGPMQIIFIMGCQTLFIPALFAVLQYCPTGIPEMDSNVLTLVAVFLPLSAIWAASAIETMPNSQTHLVPRASTWGEGSTLRGSSTLAGSASSLRKEKTSRRYSPTLAAVASVDDPWDLATNGLHGHGHVDLPIELALQPGQSHGTDDMNGANGPPLELKG